ncbi:MAG: hypothetical protein K6D92_07300 [Erysipelotrichaceae bacterium]|nr:hypothetical protein [Erysipelotrichaceae bacterium]
MKKILRPLFSVILFIAAAFFAMRIFEQAQPAFSPFEETDPQSYVYVSEGTVILDNELPEEEILKQLEKAVAEKAEHICIRDHERFEWHDLLSLDYSSFWLKEFGTVSYPDSRIEGDERDSEITFYEMTYCDLSDEEIASMKAEIDGAVNEILVQIPEDADLWHKIKTVHDLLCQKTEYDRTLALPHCQNAYGALVSGKAVCSGYAAAFRVLMGKLGVDSPIIVSEDHAWNYIDANTYENYIDVTWDDMDRTENNDTDVILYDFFRLTKEEVESVDMHTILDGGIAEEREESLADPETFNYFRHEGLFLEEYSREELVSVLRRQLDSGKELLSVRMTEEGFEKLRSLEDEELSRIVYDAGFRGRFRFWYNDDLHILNILPGYGEQ